ncbi:hypothetical protein Plhal304r1_c043g0122831 [Plasmopara halstedii]
MCHTSSFGSNCKEYYSRMIPAAGVVTVCAQMEVWAQSLSFGSLLLWQREVEKTISFYGSPPICGRRSTRYLEL